MVYNFVKGIEVRNVSDGALRSTFPPDAGERYLIPVKFVHGGHAIARGTTSGTVSMWDLSTLKKIQDLPHQGAHFAVLLHSRLCPSSEYDRVLAFDVSPREYSARNTSSSRLPPEPLRLLR